MRSPRSRLAGRSALLPTWRRGFDLAWPVMAEQVLRTLMRTTDVVVAGLLSPAAIAAVGLGDMYGRLLVRIGLGLGDGTIAMTSQDTGSGALGNRDEAVSQGLLLAAIAGLPFVVLGLLLDEAAIAVLGADADVVRLGAQYLSVIMLVAPAIHVTFVGARAIQGTGDTRTPMVVNVVANVVNIAGTVTLALGLGPAPALGVLGIAAATAVGETLAAVSFLLVIHLGDNDLRLVWPTDAVVTRQLVAISLPRMAEGLELLAEFPFNAILLLFGTEANAAYHIGRRLYQQIASPLSRGYGTAANVMVGQSLGRDRPDRAWFEGLAIAGLAVLTIGALSLVLYRFAGAFVRLFTRDPATLAHGVGFARAYAVSMAIIAAYLVLAGALRGGSETLTPFLAKLSGAFVFLLGVTYVGGLHLGYGVVAAHVAILLDFTWRAGVVGAVFARRRWLVRGRSMLVDRGSLEARRVPEAATTDHDEGE